MSYVVCLTSRLYSAENKWVKFHKHMYIYHMQSVGLVILVNFFIQVTIIKLLIHESRSNITYYHVNLCEGKCYILKPLTIMIYVMKPSIVLCLMNTYRDEQRQHGTKVVRQGKRNMAAE